MKNFISFFTAACFIYCLALPVTSHASDSRPTTTSQAQADFLRCPNGHPAFAVIEEADNNAVLIVCLECGGILSLRETSGSYWELTNKVALQQNARDKRILGVINLGNGRFNLIPLTPGARESLARMGTTPDQNEN